MYSYQYMITQSNQEAYYNVRSKGKYLTPQRSCQPAETPLRTRRTHCGTGPVGGGDINEAYHLVLQDGRDLFLQVHANVAADFFTAEASGLAALRQAGLPVPEVLGCGRNYLLLSYVKSARKSRDYWQQLGYELEWQDILALRRNILDCFLRVRCQYYL